MSCLVDKALIVTVKACSPALPLIDAIIGIITDNAMKCCKVLLNIPIIIELIVAVIRFIINHGNLFITVFSNEELISLSDTIPKCKTSFSAS